MTSSPAFRCFALAFGTAFALIYVIARFKGLALFTVYPSLGIVLLGMHRSRDVADPVFDFLAPEMFWYGWTATATLGALVIGSIAALLPARYASLTFDIRQTDSAVSYIKQHAKDAKPFFMDVNFIKMHNPTQCGARVQGQIASG